MTLAEAKLKKLQDLLSMMNESITKQEFVDAFAAVVKLVKGIQDSNSQEWSLIKSNLGMMQEQLKTDNSSDLSELKKAMTDYCAKELAAMQKDMDKMMFEHDAMIAEADAKMDAIEDGHTPTEAELIALITPLIPKIEVAEAPEVDIDAIVRQVMDKLPKPAAGGVGWGAHPLAIAQSGTVKEKVARHINFKGTGVTSVVRNPNGTVDVTITAGAGGGGTPVYNEVVAGNTNTFTLAHTPTAGTLRVYALGQRQVLTTDFTLVGAVITTVNTWSTGDLVADYSY